MNKKVNNYGWLISAILEIILGIILILKPKEFTNLIFNCLGIALIAYGIIACIDYFRTSKEIAMFEHSLTKGIIFTIIGMVCIFGKEMLIESVTVIYGIIIIIGSILKIQFTADLIRIKEKLWYITLIESIIAIILGILIIKNPFTAVKALWTFIGISIIIEGIFNAVIAGYWYAIRRKIEDMLSVSTKD